MPFPTIIGKIYPARPSAESRRIEWPSGRDYNIVIQEAVMRTAVRKLGNSSGVIIPRLLLEEIGLGVGGAVEMTLEEGHIVLSPVQGRPRAGWAEASKKLAEAGGDALAWPEFGNAEDEILVW